MSEVLSTVGSAELTEWFAVFEIERRELEKMRGEQPADADGPPAVLGG